MACKLRHGKILGSCKAGLVVFVSAIFVLVFGGFLFGAKQKDDSGPASYAVFSFRHISAQKGKEYLAQMQLGTVSQLPGADMLLVTGSSRELIKARVVLQMVDSKEQFVIREVFSASSPHDLPSNKQIAAEVGEVAIGTFSDVPANTAGARAIIDLHNEAVIAIAPASHLEKIVSAIEQMQKKEPGIAVAEPNLALPQEVLVDLLEQPTIDKPEDINNLNDEFFNKLLNSLAEAEKRAAGQAQEVNEPNEPNDVAALPEANVPGEPAVGPEPPPVVTEQLSAAELAAILKRLAALEAKVKAEPEPNEPEAVTVKEAVTVEIEQPNEVAEPVITGRYEPEPIPDGNDIIQLNLPPGLTIVEFLDLMTMNLNLDYLYDPKKLIGNVHIKFGGLLKGDIRRDELYPLFESVMHFNNFVMTRKGNLLIVVPKAEADTIDPPFVDPDRAKPEYGDIIVNSFFTLKHISTASAKSLLAAMQLGLEGKIREIPETGTLIVTGYAYRMPRIEQVLEAIDKPGEPKTFKFRPLIFTRATALAPKVKTLAEQLGTISISVSAAARTAPALRRKPGESAAAFRARQAAARRAGARPPPARAAAAKPTVYLDADERTNRILMIGQETQLKIVNQLIDSLDVEQQDLRTLRSYEIQNVDAEEVRTKLSEIGIISGARTTTRRGTATKAPPGGKAGARTPVTTTTTRTAEALVEEPQVVIIESTNSLLVNATAEQHAQIVMIIGYVDREVWQTTIPYVVYPLENQDPTKLSDILNQFVKETITGKDAKGGKIERTEKKLEEDIVIIPDENTFSLIVYATKKNQQWIETLIRQLDKRRPQVLIDVTFVQITKDDIFNFDLSLLGAYPNLEYTSGQTGASTSVIDLLLDPARDRDRFLDFTTTGGNFTGFYGDRAINALLTAVHTKSYGRVMARPKILVNDNETGTITTSDTTYIERSQTSIIGTDNPQTTTQQVFDQYSAGITLNITPHISEGEMLRLEISLNRSGFDPETLGLEKPPDRSDSDITTIVTVPNKSTIILGGMEKVEHGKGGNKVPILGDLPLIGGAFRNVKRLGTHNKLYIFVKAHILRPGGETALADLKEVSRKNREAFEKLEREMQEYEVWPGIKPEPLDPLRILEAD